MERDSCGECIDSERVLLSRSAIVLALGIAFCLHASLADSQTVTKYNYDAGNHVTQITDPRGLLTTYIYDGLGQKWQQNSPDTGATNFSYDGYGRLASLTRSDGSVTAYGYDGINRRTSVTAGNATQTFTYDNCANGNGIGRLCWIRDATATTSYEYSPEGWVTYRGFGIGATGWGEGYAYNALGQVTTVTYPDGNQALYSYTNGVVSAVQTVINGTVSNAATNISYRPSDVAMSQWTSSNGLVNTLSYDNDGHLTGVAVPGVQGLGLAYDAADRITSISNAIDPTVSQSFGYDAMSRLISVYSTADNEAFQYDANGNRISVAANGSNATLALQANNNWLLSMSGTANASWAYDAKGNLTTFNGVTLFAYDSFNRLQGAGGATYYVDPEGQRLTKTVNGTITYFLPDMTGGMLAESQPNSTWTDYVWLNGRLIGRVSGGQLQAIHVDQVGRPEAVTDGSKSVVWRAQNLAFDRQVTITNAVPLNLGFPGQYYDAESGLWNNGFRDYWPAMGRYIESDPIGLAAGINTYAYVSASPLRNIDPLGLETGAAYRGIYRGDGGVPVSGAVRGPDYVSFQIDIYVLSISATYTRYGDIFLGKGTNRAFPNPTSYGVSISDGWLIDPCDDGGPSRDKLNDFLDGYSGGVGAYSGVGGSYSINPSGQAFNIGVGAGGFGVSPMMVNSYQGNIFGDPR